MTERRLVQLQALSGATFAVFLIVHLVNQMLAALGPTVYNGTQRVLRQGYQAPLLEIGLVLGPLVVHAAASVARVWRRRRAARQPVSAWTRLHRLSGVFLIIVFTGHVLATRGASFLYGVYPEFAGVAYSFQWRPAYFWPYYIALALTGLYHMLYGLSVALPVLGLRRGAKLRRPAVLGSLAAVGGLALLVGVLRLGGLFGADVHAAASPYAKLLLRLVGP